MYPICRLNSLKGMQATRLGHRHKAEPVVRAEDPRGKTIYWVGPAGCLNRMPGRVPIFMQCARDMSR